MKIISKVKKLKDKILLLCSNIKLIESLVNFQ